MLFTLIVSLVISYFINPSGDTVRIIKNKNLKWPVEKPVEPVGE